MDQLFEDINLYGATKLCSDKLFIAANNFKGKRDIIFSVVRYGNVMGSRGSVIPYFLKTRSEGVIQITDERMTRFNITWTEAVELVFFAPQNMWGGEIFVPKIPSYRITDLADAIAPGCRRKIVGIRPGEKLHEEMITETDGLNTIEFIKYFVILPSTPLWDVNKFMSEFKGSLCQPDFRYSSGTNSEWLTVEQLRKMIRLHVDPEFSLSPVASLSKCKSPGRRGKDFNPRWEVTGSR